MKIFNKAKINKGMTYIELIVVLSIFSAISSVAIFNYGDFQAKVDIKNLSSDIALKIVEAQKSALSGVLPPSGFAIGPSWKPSYGVHFFSPVADNANFIYFADLNSDMDYTDGSSCAGECLSKINITKNNSISSLDVFYQNETQESLTDLTVSFSRPNSGAFISSSLPTVLKPDIDYVQITILSPQGATSLIKLYPSGRVQIN